MSHSIHSSSFTSAGSHLCVDGLSFSYPGRRVLTDVSFVVAAGDRYGLIGENGAGKSTLLRLIAGVLEPTAGTITLNSPAKETPKIGLLHQEPPFSVDATIAQSLETAVAPARRAARAVNTLAAGMAERPDDPQTSSAYSHALDVAERLGAWDIEARVSAMLSGLGLGAIDRNRQTGELSGGQRARLALAWLLINAPDILLLDEPTNHLDDAAATYLVSVLSKWRGPVLLASHDRAFLDETVTALLDLDPSPVPHAVAGTLVEDGTGTGIGLSRFTGGYSDYLAARKDERERWERQYRDEQAELSRLRAAVRDEQTVGHDDWRPRTESRIAKKFYADRNARVVSRRVRDARKRLRELEDRQVQKPPQEIAFHGLTAAGQPRSFSASEPVLVAEQVAVRNRLAQTSLSVSRGEKWLLTGPNGSGKSTLLEVLAGRLTPHRGQIARSSNDRVGMLTQETQLPDPNRRGASRTVNEAYTDLVGEQLARSVPLDTFGLIAARDQNRPVNELSVGQQRRLALAVLLANPPEILLLDEPTNHLSLSLVTELEDALTSYPGTVVIATHDRWLRKRWSGQNLELHET
jgi:macrolide transport system ATP-binding/permease protein